MRFLFTCSRIARGFASGRCVDIPGGDATAGVRLRMWDCRRTAGQPWSFPSDCSVR
ncbi:ricin-type beta-trefoil lectin domain protein [Micromonospora avicenniae]|uniref:ricin-type beta-trefoil lectin domain protein n=1 Tax=Micromonospora avicenniae TaxID=1198245 RepID=UPI001115808D|nr:ricin-type beta-trefoil lectin domain protein [Micromonospora avicenniae]